MESSGVKRGIPAWAVDFSALKVFKVDAGGGNWYHHREMLLRRWKKLPLCLINDWFVAPLFFYSSCFHGSSPPPASCNLFVSSDIFLMNVGEMAQGQHDRYFIIHHLNATLRDTLHQWREIETG